MTDKTDYTTLSDDELLELCTDKQKVFISDYLTHFNGVRAAQTANYSEGCLKQLASETLSKPYVKEYKDRKVKQIIAQTDDKRAKLIRFWESVIDDPESSESAKQKASDSLGKYLAMFTEKLELSGEVLQTTHFIVEGNEQD